MHNLIASLFRFTKLLFKFFISVWDRIVLRLQMKHYRKVVQDFKKFLLLQFSQFLPLFSFHFGDNHTSFSKLLLGNVAPINIAITLV